MPFTLVQAGKYETGHYKN